MRNGVIERDLEDIGEALREFESYCFSSELRERMTALSLSSVTLGARAGVSHTIVDRWLKEKATPNSKERMKKLGMALEMDERELNRFLYRNGYPGLYAKNPLDGVALRLLRSAAGRADMVELYTVLLEELELSGFCPERGAYSLRTSVMLSGLLKQEEERLPAWFAEHQHDFTADAKTMLPDRNLADFLRLYMGDESINSLCLTRELPQPLGALLYALVSGKPVTIRGLREKLIALGLFFNMTEEEIDILLGFVRLRPVTMPSTRLDMALLLALREGHEHYALYESENLEHAISYMERSDHYPQPMRTEYRLRALDARVRAHYYNRTERSDEEREFEESYTSYADRGLMDYVRELLIGLSEDGSLRQSELDEITDYITRSEEGEASWR